MDPRPNDSETVTLPSSCPAGEGRAAEALGPLPAGPPLGLQSLGPGEELPVPGEVSQEALQGRQCQGAAAVTVLAWQRAAAATDHAGPGGAGHQVPRGPHSLALGPQPVREQRGGLHPGPHHGGDSRGE